MTEPTERPAVIHSTTNFHCYGAISAKGNFIPRETADMPDYGGSYGYVSLSGDAPGADLTVFVLSRAQAESIAAAFWAISTQFPPSPCPAADVAHECGSPAAAELDTSDYPVPMTVSQRDPADPESWIYRCGADHGADLTTERVIFTGWQSADYASEDDALSAAADHARAMHDGGLPNDLAERVAAAERRAAERADSLIGRNVRRTDDDGAVPMVGTIHAITADPEIVMVAWPRADSAEPAVTIPEPMDELTAAGGRWAVRVS